MRLDVFRLSSPLRLKLSSSPLLTVPNTSRVRLVSSRVLMVCKFEQVIRARTIRDAPSAGLQAPPQPSLHGRPLTSRARRSIASLRLPADESADEPITLAPCVMTFEAATLLTGAEMLNFVPSSWTGSTQPQQTHPQYADPNDNKDAACRYTDVLYKE